MERESSEDIDKFAETYRESQRQDFFELLDRVQLETAKRGLTQEILDQLLKEN